MSLAAGIVGLALSAASVTSVQAGPQTATPSVQADSVVPGLPGGFSMWSQYGGVGAAVLRNSNRVAIYVPAEGGGSCFTGTLSSGRATGFSRGFTSRGGRFTRSTIPVNVGKSGLVLGAGPMARIPAGTALYRMATPRMLGRLNECRAVAGRGGVFGSTAATAQSIFRSTLGVWPWQRPYAYPYGVQLAVTNSNYGWIWSNGWTGFWFTRRVAPGAWKTIPGMLGTGRDQCAPSSMRAAGVPASVQRDFIAAVACQPRG